MIDPKVMREQTIRDAKSNIILDAARKVFSEKGYYDTRLEDIAAAAGFSKASLYNYYDDKEKIFLNLAIREFDGLLRKLNAGISPDLKIFDMLDNILRTVLSFFGEHFAFFLAVVNYRSACPAGLGELREQHNELLARFHQEFSSIMSTFVSALSIARQRNEISSSIDEVVLAKFMSSLVRGVIFDWKISGKMGDIDTTVKQILEFVAGGVGCAGAVPNGSTQGGC